LPELAWCGQTNEAIAVQLYIFGAMAYKYAQLDMAVWVKEAKITGEVIIEGKRGYKGKPLIK